MMGAIIGGFELVIIAAVLSPLLVWLIRAASEHSARRRAEWVHTTARVADVSTIDVYKNDGGHSHTTDRFVVVFELASGERHAADKTGPLSQVEKGILLPDRVVPIRYDARDPDRFEVDWDALREGEKLAGPAAVAATKDRPRPVYAPPQ